MLYFVICSRTFSSTTDTFCFVSECSRGICNEHLVQFGAAALFHTKMMPFYPLMLLFYLLQHRNEAVTQQLWWKHFPFRLYSWKSLKISTGSIEGFLRILSRDDGCETHRVQIHGCFNFSSDGKTVKMCNENVDMSDCKHSYI